MSIPKFIRTVTVTGADDGTDIAKLFELQKRFPFAEFGILLSQKYSTGAGGSRFPSAEWLAGLATTSGLRLSGHLCGTWVREFLQHGVLPDFENIATGLGAVFQRFQINTHAEPHAVVYDPLFKTLSEVKSSGVKFIFQLDGLNNLVPSKIIEGHPEIDNVQGLADLSHGAGVLPANWPKPANGFPIGYAGGLSPENVVSQIGKIHEACGMREIWIDAETHLRTGSAFDLAKVADFLQRAQPFVI